MPTRADLYVGEGEDAEWLGSVPWDGYPDGIDQRVFEATTESEYRNAVSVFLTMANNHDGATLPFQGWPWAWKDSRDTNYAYAWMDGRVWASNFGDPWFLVQPDVDDHGEVSAPGDRDIYGEPPSSAVMESRKVSRGYPVFPNMRDRQSARYNKGSGLIPGPRTHWKG